MDGYDVEPSVNAAEAVSFLYSAVERLDLESFTQLVWADAPWHSATACGRGGAELFTALLDLIAGRRLQVCQLVAQRGTVIALGVLPMPDAAGTAERAEFAHIWQLQEGCVARVRLFMQPCGSAAGKAH